jgi:hypothetical protein
MVIRQNPEGSASGMSSNDYQNRGQLNVTQSLSLVNNNRLTTTNYKSGGQNSQAQNLDSSKMNVTNYSKQKNQHEANNTGKIKIIKKHEQNILRKSNRYFKKTIVEKSLNGSDVDVKPNNDDLSLLKIPTQVAKPSPSNQLTANTSISKKHSYVV